jgi:transposase
MAVMPYENREAFEPAFVPLAITTEPPQITDTSPVLEPVATTSAIVTLEIGSDLVVRVPGDVPVDRVAALVRAMRGTA